MKKIKKKKSFLGTFVSMVGTVSNIVNSIAQNQLQREQMEKKQRLYNENVARENALRQTQNIQNDVDFIDNIKKEYITPLKFGGKRIKQKTLNHFK